MMFNYLDRLGKYFRITKKIIARKPILVFRVIYNYCRIIILREKVVRKVEIGTSFDCQCRCPKCSSDLMRSPQRARLNLREFKGVANDIMNLGAIHINFTGGEPLLATDIFEMIKCFRPQRTIISINSNGLLLTDDMIDKLEKAGVDIIKISIDSPIEKEHDHSRCYSGCFQSAVKALEYIKKKKHLLAHISTVCTKENLNSGRIWDIVKMAGDYGALLGLTVPTYSGGWQGSEEVLLGEKEKKIMESLTKIPYVIRDIDEGYAKKHCPAGSEEFYLTCYGDVIPCPFIQISFGNVRDKNIKTIWREMNNFSEFKKNPSCLAGENRDFIESYLYPLARCKDLPMRAEEHSAIKK
jgi:MoaA/NifB/PqqE/SkfB family radical SAM enzyme